MHSHSIRRGHVGNTKFESLALLCVFLNVVCFLSAATLTIQHVMEVPMYCTGAAFSCLGGFGMITVRSLISKQVPDEEQGKVFSMLASWESILPLISSPMYTLVYNASITSFPGACYFMSAGCYILAECAFM